MMKSSRSRSRSAEEAMKSAPLRRTPRTRSHGIHPRPAQAFYAVATVLVSCTTVLMLTAGVGASPRAAVQDEHPKFPQGPGRDVALRVCSKCHDPELAADQQNDKAGWKELVDQMASKGADATDAEFAQIVEYLATAFPAK